MIIQMIIKRSYINVHIRVGSLYGSNTLRSSYQIHHLNLGASAVLQRGDRRNSRTPCCEHRIDNNQLTLLHIRRKLNIIFNRLQRFRITE
ncbi:hypothetical protein D3C80_1861680 [compost metagenome]